VQKQSLKLRVTLGGILSEQNLGTHGTNLNQHNFDVLLGKSKAV